MIAREARDDYAQLLGFSSRLYGDAHKSIVELSISMLPEEFSQHLNEKVPYEKFESDYDWLFALKKEVDGVLLPMVRARAPQKKVYFEAAAAFLTPDRILQDLELEERLNANIERAIRRLYQDKAAQELYRPKQPKLIERKGPMQLENPETAQR